MNEKKIFIIKKGQPDWQVWSKVTNWLFSLMGAKRKRLFSIRKLRKDIKITVTITDIKDKTQ